jgi:hypothetical protein
MRLTMEEGIRREGRRKCVEGLCGELNRAFSLEMRLDPETLEEEETDIAVDLVPARSSGLLAARAKLYVPQPPEPENPPSVIFFLYGDRQRITRADHKGDYLTSIRNTDGTWQAPWWVKDSYDEWDDVPPPQ